MGNDKDSWKWSHVSLPPVKVSRSVTEYNQFLKRLFEGKTILTCFCSYPCRVKLWSVFCSYDLPVVTQCSVLCICLLFTIEPLRPWLRSFMLSSTLLHGRLSRPARSLIPLQSARMNQWLTPANEVVGRVMFLQVSSVPGRRITWIGHLVGYPPPSHRHQTWWPTPPLPLLAPS